MKGLSGTKKPKEPLFQVLLLDNDADLNVKVHETPQVDYSTVKEHLQKGGSVFITTKNQKKLPPPKAGKAQHNYALVRRKLGNIIQKSYRKPRIV
jgi:hypothetical protein